MPQDKEKAEKLKAMANELYGKKDFKGAYQQYTEAIKADGTNAIYYANRAAASLAMQQYMNTCTDANKAIELDPTYIKGHSRLAAGKAGLSLWESAAKAWQKALELLPQSDAQLSPTERTLKAHFRAELRKAEDALNRRDDGHSIGVGKDDMAKTAWQRAKAEEDKLRADGIANSSGWVILHAYHEFSEGVDTMKSLATKMVNGKQALFGRTDGLVNITNGIMRDSRVFHIDSQDWFQKLNKQTLFEMQNCGAWSKVGPNVVMEEAPKRLRQKGWNSVRPAISTTVRAWYMSGCVAFKMSRELGAAYEYLSQAVQVLQWGQRLWHNVPTEERGAVFEQSFIRGIRRLKLEVMLGRLMLKENCSYTKKQVADEALAMIEDVETYPPRGEIDPGFFLSFWVYPKAEALATVGWYHMQTGFSSATFEDAKASFAKAYEYYAKASEILPPDEEFAFQYLHVALESLWFSGQPAEKQVPVLAKLNQIGRSMMRFWVISPSAEQRDAQLHVLLSYTNQLLSGLSSGKYHYTTVTKPSTVKSRDKWGDGEAVYVDV